MAALPYYASVLMAVVSPFILIHALIYVPLTTGIDPFRYVGGLMLTYFFLSLTAFYMTRSPYMLHGMFFALLYIGVLSWQNYYAIFTMNKTKWGTR